MRNHILCNQRGSVINIALLILILLTLLGVTFANMTATDIKISGNGRAQNLSFYAAEAARGYVAAKPELYNSTNVTTSQPVSFPVAADEGAISTSLGSKQDFSGTVQYLGHGDPPRGSGYAADKFQAHRYKMVCEGVGPGNAHSTVEAGFYRIGF